MPTEHPSDISRGVHEESILAASLIIVFQEGAWLGQIIAGGDESPRFKQQQVFRKEFAVDLIRVPFSRSVENVQHLVLNDREIRLSGSGRCLSSRGKRCSLPTQAVKIDHPLCESPHYDAVRQRRAMLVVAHCVRQRLALYLFNEMVNDTASFYFVNSVRNERRTVLDIASLLDLRDSQATESELFHEFTFLRHPSHSESFAQDTR